VADAAKKEKKEFACFRKVGNGGADTSDLQPAGQHEHCQAPPLSITDLFFLRGYL